MQQVTDFDLRLLRVFVAVAEARGFAAAESYLNLSTSTISVHMSNLEGRLGIRLCERGRGGFSLTERGRIVYQEAKGLLKSLDDFSGALASVKSLLAGRLSIGMVDALVMHPNFPISDAVREFNSVDNDVQFELIVAPRQTLEHDVVEGRIHAAIGPFVRRISGLSFTPLFSEYHDLYCGVGHTLFGASKKVVDKADLSTHPAVVRRYHDEFDRNRLGVVRVAAFVNSMEAMLTLLLTGDYIGYLPRYYARKWIQDGRLSRIDKQDASYQSEHALVTKKGSGESLVLGKFVSLITEAAASGVSQSP